MAEASEYMLWSQERENVWRHEFSDIWGTSGPFSEATEAENLDLSRIRCKHTVKDSVGTEKIWKQVSWHHINMENRTRRVGVSRVGVVLKGKVRAVMMRRGACDPGRR
jgi:hypothetical protein